MIYIMLILSLLLTLVLDLKYDLYHADSLSASNPGGSGECFEQVSRGQIHPPCSRDRRVAQLLARVAMLRARVARGSSNTVFGSNGCNQSSSKCSHLTGCIRYCSLSLALLLTRIVSHLLTVTVLLICSLAHCHCFAHLLTCLSCLTCSLAHCHLYCASLFTHGMSAVHQILIQQMMRQGTLSCSYMRS